MSLIYSRSPNTCVTSRSVRVTIEYTFKDHNLIQFHLLEVATNFSDPKQFITFSRGFLTFVASYNILF